MALELETLAVALVASVDKFQKDLNAADKMAQGWGDKIGGSLGKLAIGGAVAGGAAVAGALAVVGKAAFDVSSQVDAAAADMAASLNVPTAEAEKFADVARNVFGNNFADSVTDAAEGVKQIALQMGLAADDPALQKMTENAFRLRDVFDMEVNESVSAAQTLMDNFGISGEEAFDLIAAANQKGLNRAGDLVDTIEEYSTQFANGGASAQQFFGLLESGAAGGMLGTDKAADAFKEFQLRIQDGSTLTAESLAAIGLSADEITAGLANGTLTAADAFTMVQTALANTTDPVTQFNAGVGLMGSQFEDLGADAALGLSLVNESFANSQGAVDSLDAKYATFGDAAQGIWRRIIVSVSPLTDKLLDLVNDAMPKVMAAFDAFDKNVGPAIEHVQSVISNVVGTVTGLFAQFRKSVDEDGTGPLTYWQEWADKNLPMVQKLFENILGAIQGFWNLFGEDIMHVVDNTFNTVFTVIDTVMKTIGDLITLVLQVLTGDWEGAWETMQGIVERIWDTIKTVIDNQLDSIKTAITSIDWAELGRSIIQGMIDGIVAMSTRLWEAAKTTSENLWKRMTGWWSTGSPSKKAEIGLGQPIGQGIARGIPSGLQQALGRVDMAMSGLFNDLQGQQPVAAASGSTIHATFNLYGTATRDDGRAVAGGFLDEMRQQGML